MCHHDLTKNINAIDTDSPVGILQGIVSQFTAEVYNESIKFKSILSDYFANDKTLLKVLKIIIDNNGAVDIYKNSNLDNTQFDLKVRTILLRVSDDSLVAQDVLSDGIVLLCKWLGKDFAYSNNQQPKSTQLNTTQASNTQPSKSSPLSDFKIENGELIEYLGSGRDVVIPDSVTSIGKQSFGGCSSLVNITIPNSVTSIGNSTFDSCSSLKTVILPRKLKYDPSIFLTATLI